MILKELSSFLLRQAKNIALCLSFSSRRYLEGIPITSYSFFTAAKSLFITLSMKSFVRVAVT
jgi:hypothetical protein